MNENLLSLTLPNIISVIIIVIVGMALFGGIIAAFSSYFSPATAQQAGSNG